MARPPMISANHGLDEHLRKLFQEELNIEVPSAEADLMESGLMDSLVLVELLVRLEERFGIDVDILDLDIENFRTLHRIARLVAQLRSHEVVDER
jgi:D-alanine--poly(phosphoribitol) ligase subunit 2